MNRHFWHEITVFFLKCICNLFSLNDQFEIILFIYYIIYMTFQDFFPSLLLFGGIRQSHLGCRPVQFVVLHLELLWQHQGSQLQCQESHSRPQTDKADALFLIHILEPIQEVIGFFFFYLGCFKPFLPIIILQET